MDMDKRMRKWFPNSFTNEIPAEKKKIVARLDIMKLDDWKALESMTIEELDALQEEAESAVYNVDDFGYVSPNNDHDRTIMEAREAIKNQRYKARKEIADKKMKQDDRRVAILSAASHIQMAINLVEQAHGIELDPTYYPCLIPTVKQVADISEMGDGELNHIVNSCDPQTIANPLPDYSLLEVLNTPTAKEIAKEVKEQNRAFNKRIEVMRANWTAAKGELGRRRENEQQAAKRDEELSANLPGVLAELTNRIKELEASK